MNKSVLLLKLLDLLKADPTLDAADIARELGRSERTVYRYLQALGSDLSVPIYFEQGYKMLGRPRLAPIDFTESEALALRLALGAAPLKKTAPLNQHAASALKKVEAAMTEASYLISRKAAGKVSLSIPAHETPPQKQSLLPVIESAVMNQGSLHLEYRSLKGGQIKSRKFDPYALVFRRHNWYLVGLCYVRKEIIQLKVSRIHSAVMSDERFERPPDFSVDKFYEGSWEVLTGPLVRVEIVFDKNVAPLILEGKRHPTQETKKRSDGSVLFTAEVAGYEEIGWWVLSFGGAAEVVEPPVFREWITHHVQRMASCYLKSM